MRNLMPLLALLVLGAIAPAWLFLTKREPDTGRAHVTLSGGDDLGRAMADLEPLGWRCHAVEDAASCTLVGRP